MLWVHGPFTGKELVTTVNNTITTTTIERTTTFTSVTPLVETVVSRTVSGRLHLVRGDASIGSTRITGALFRAPRASLFLDPHGLSGVAGFAYDDGVSHGGGPPRADAGVGRSGIGRLPFPRADAAVGRGAGPRVDAVPSRAAIGHLLPIGVVVSQSLVIVNVAPSIDPRDLYGDANVTYDDDVNHGGGPLRVDVAPSRAAIGHLRPTCGDDASSLDPRGLCGNVSGATHGTTHLPSVGAGSGDEDAVDDFADDSVALIRGWV